MVVSWWVELVVRPGCLDEFETLTSEMVASAQAESARVVTATTQITVIKPTSMPRRAAR